MAADARRKRERQDQARKKLAKLREPVIRILPALGLYDAVQHLARPLREALYNVPRGKLLVRLHPDARRFEGARFLFKFMTKRLEIPAFDVPGISRKLSPDEVWSLLPMLAGCLEFYREKGLIPREPGREFFEADFGALIERLHAQLSWAARSWTWPTLGLTTRPAGSKSRATTSRIASNGSSAPSQRSCVTSRWTARPVPLSARAST